MAHVALIHFAMFTFGRTNLFCRYVYLFLALTPSLSFKLFLVLTHVLPCVPFGSPTEGCHQANHCNTQKFHFSNKKKYVINNFMFHISIYRIMFKAIILVVNRTIAREAVGA